MQSGVTEIKSKHNAAMRDALFVNLIRINNESDNQQGQALQMRTTVIVSMMKNTRRYVSLMIGINRMLLLLLITGMKKHSSDSSVSSSSPLSKSTTTTTTTTTWPLSLSNGNKKSQFKTELAQIKRR
jgi:hypothetical protein